MSTYQNRKKKTKPKKNETKQEQTFYTHETEKEMPILNGYYHSVNSV